MILLSDRYETYENTRFWHLDVTKHCVFTGFVVTSCQKPCFSLVFAAFSHGFLRMSLVFFVFLHFLPFLHFRVFAPWRCVGPRAARGGQAKMRKRQKMQKTTKKTKDILRKPCEKAAKTCVFLGFAPIGGPKPMKTQGFLIQMRSNLVFSQVWGLRWVQNLRKHRFSQLFCMVFLGCP